MEWARFLTFRRGQRRREKFENIVVKRLLEQEGRGAASGWRKLFKELHELLLQLQICSE
jgi:hypothetical protein